MSFVWDYSNLTHVYNSPAINLIGSDSFIGLPYVSTLWYNYPLNVSLTVIIDRASALVADIWPQNGNIARPEGLLRWHSIIWPKVGLGNTERRYRLKRNIQTTHVSAWLWRMHISRVNILMSGRNGPRFADGIYLKEKFLYPSQIFLNLIQIWK